MIKELKIRPEFYIPIECGEKTFEVRKNDRNFAVGDILWLREYREDIKKYTDRSLYAIVTYILDNKEFCLPGFVILSIKLF